MTMQGERTWVMCLRANRLRAALTAHCAGQPLPEHFRADLQRYLRVVSDGYGSSSSPGKAFSDTVDDPHPAEPDSVPFVQEESGREVDLISQVLGHLDEGATGLERPVAKQLALYLASVAVSAALSAR